MNEYLIEHGVLRRVDQYGSKDDMVCPLGPTCTVNCICFSDRETEFRCLNYRIKIPLKGGKPDGTNARRELES